MARRSNPARRVRSTTADRQCRRCACLGLDGRAHAQLVLVLRRIGARPAGFAIARWGRRGGKSMPATEEHWPPARAKPANRGAIRRPPGSRGRRRRGPSRPAPRPHRTRFVSSRRIGRPRADQSGGQQAAATGGPVAFASLRYRWRACTERGRRRPTDGCGCMWRLSMSASVSRAPPCRKDGNLAYGHQSFGSPIRCFYYCSWSGRRWL